MAEKQEKVKRLFRSKKNRILGGVCAGVAEYLGIDPNIVRVIWIVVSLVYGIGLLAYIVMWLLLPENQD
ncbi:MAG: PspC domain-containing protein [Candidatus Micrarchaeia archaeon]